MNSPETFEVELKFPIVDADEMTLQLLARGARRGGVVRQSDLYFQHPCRDFRQTHEALRLRKTVDGLRITYKGPIIDSRTKMRRELELPVGRDPGDFDQFRELLTILGFEPVRDVVKTRAIYDLMWEGRQLELAVDAVDGLGTFLEIESMASDSDRDAARDAILQLAEKLGLKDPEKRSYLQLLIQQASGEDSIATGPG
ncbi:MAG TPA: class IV adenylate cyclase [Planctomycetaceae bacterium]|jgi:adenylate cyclase class 2|nr:class IV adenylate cyclase [Planctomycetaceae bacterium]